MKGDGEDFPTTIYILLEIAYSIVCLKHTKSTAFS